MVGFGVPGVLWFSSRVHSKCASSDRPCHAPQGFKDKPMKTNAVRSTWPFEDRSVQTCGWYPLAVLQHGCCAVTHTHTTHRTPHTTHHTPHTTICNQVTDFAWNPVVPWTLASMSSCWEGELRGEVGQDHALQVWRPSDEALLQVPAVERQEGRKTAAPLPPGAGVTE